MMLCFLPRRQPQPRGLPVARPAHKPIGLLLVEQQRTRCEACAVSLGMSCLHPHARCRSLGRQNCLSCGQLAQTRAVLCVGRLGSVERRRSCAHEKKASQTLALDHPRVQRKRLSLH